MSVKVIKSMKFLNASQAETFLRQSKAAFRRYEEGTMAPLYKTPAGVVFRLTNSVQPQVDVLANCVC
jgi:hypothetical protein